MWWIRHTSQQIPISPCWNSIPAFSQQAAPGTDCRASHPLQEECKVQTNTEPPWGNSCSQGRQSSSGPCQSGMGDTERKINVNHASFVDIPSLFPCIPCAWHGHEPHLAGERGKGAAWKWESDKTGQHLEGNCNFHSIDPLCTSVTHWVYLQN